MAPRSRASASPGNNQFFLLCQAQQKNLCAVVSYAEVCLRNLIFWFSFPKQKGMRKGWWGLANRWVCRTCMIADLFRSAFVRRRMAARLSRKLGCVDQNKMPNLWCTILGSGGCGRLIRLRFRITRAPSMDTYLGTVAVREQPWCAGLSPHWSTGFDWVPRGNGSIERDDRKKEGCEKGRHGFERGKSSANRHLSFRSQ